MRSMDHEKALYLPDGDGFVATLRTQGGWNPHHQHGGPVQALLARAVAQTPTLVAMQVARLTHDLFRPIPIGPRLTVTTEIVREGKRIQVVDAVLRVGEVEHARTRALRLREEDLTDVTAIRDPSDHGPEPQWAEELPETVFATPADTRPGFLEGIELRYFPRPDGVEGSFGLWVRLRGPLVAGEEPTPLQRLSVAADFTNLIGAVFDHQRLSGINPDLNVHLLREPVGEWVGVVGDTHLALAKGIGVSCAQLRDRDGMCGLSANSQLIQRR
jgi:hypothetical protein